MPVQFKKSREPGDSKPMVQARSQFLDTGLYQPVVNRLIELLISNLSLSHQPLIVLDAGCGEGWYTCQVEQGLKTHTEHVHVAGLDISKWAIQAAARRSKQITWVVATNVHPPVQKASLDAVFSIFGYPRLEALIPLLKPGGILVSVTAGPNHLLELREKIYQQVEINDDSSGSETSDKTVANERLTFVLKDLSVEQVSSLLQMTPHFYKVGHASREQLVNTSMQSCTVDMYYSVYRQSDFG